VRPRRWAKTNYRFLLFNNGEYSIIWGKFDGVPAMGVRWNGDEDRVGYPRQGRHPLWYVEPDIIAIGILKHLLTIQSTNNIQTDEKNIRFALKEINKKLESRKQFGS